MAVADELQYAACEPGHHQIHGLSTRDKRHKLLRPSQPIVVISGIQFEHIVTLFFTNHPSPQLLQLLQHMGSASIELVPTLSPSSANTTPLVIPHHIDIGLPNSSMDG